jgi:agmatine deiminase
MPNTPYYLPPEWVPQSAVMLTWPHADTIWLDTLAAIDAVFVQVATAVAAREQVIIACADQQHEQHIMELLRQAEADLANIRCYYALCDDIWVRDHGPITVIADNKPLLLDFIFNGWGNKYPAANDNNITRLLHAAQAFGATPRLAIDMVLEGGAIEVDGHGTLMTTKSCLLAPTRNPTLTQEQIETQLKQLFGIKRILWVDHGHLEGDDTDGHIDTLARFTDPHTICYVRCDDPHDSHFETFKNMEQQLKTFEDYQGKPYRLIPLPWPPAYFADFDGRRLPATYANFLIINGAVLVPTYNNAATDEQAVQILTDCFPDRQMIAVPSLPVIQWYGSLHCMTMQLPERGQVSPCWTT